LIVGAFFKILPRNKGFQGILQLTRKLIPGKTNKPLANYLQLAKSRKVEMRETEKLGALDVMHNWCHSYRKAMTIGVRTEGFRCGSRQTSDAFVAMIDWFS
jgi:hypothetical protein